MYSSEWKWNECREFGMNKYSIICQVKIHESIMRLEIASVIKKKRRLVLLNQKKRFSKNLNPCSEKEKHMMYENCNDR